MTPEKISEYGEELFTALRQGKTLAPLTEREPDITIEDAYRISQVFLQCRTDAGERVVGKKIGVTSKPVQDMLGVFQPDFGFTWKLFNSCLSVKALLPTMFTSATFAVFPSLMSMSIFTRLRSSGVTVVLISTEYLPLL